MPTHPDRHTPNGADVSYSTLVVFLSAYFEHTVSHFSYAPLIKCKMLGEEILYFYSETTSVMRIYLCINYWNFIVIRSEMNEKIDLEEYYPQNTVSHCIISNETQISLHFFQIEFLLYQR